MTRKPTKRNLRRSKLPEKDNNIENFYKKLISKSLKINSKLVSVSKATKPNTYKAKAYVKDHVKQLMLNKLSHMFSKNNIRLLNGNIGTSFSGAMQAKSTIDFVFKRLKAYKKPLVKRKIQVRAVYEENTMNKALVLANSISQGLILHAAANEINEMAIADDMGGFRVLKHGEGARDGMEFFKKYISERDYTNFLPFMKWLDDGCYKFRGNQEINLEDLLEDDDDDDTMGRGRGGRGRKGKKSFGVRPVTRRNNNIEKASNPDESDTSPPESDNAVVISEEKNYDKKIKDYMRAKARSKATSYIVKQ